MFASFPDRDELPQAAVAVPVHILLSLWPSLVLEVPLEDLNQSSSFAASQCSLLHETIRAIKIVIGKAEVIYMTITVVTICQSEALAVTVTFMAI